MRPASTTGHSTRPVTSSSSAAIVLEPRRPAPRPRAPSASAMMRSRSAASSMTWRVAQLVAIIGEIARRGTAPVARKRWPRVVVADRHAVERERQAPCRRTARRRSSAAAPSGTAPPGSASIWARAARRMAPRNSSGSTSAVGPARRGGSRRNRTRPCRCRAPRIRRARRARRFQEALDRRLGAPTRGPRRSSLTSGCAAASPSTTSASRRGVTKACARGEGEARVAELLRDETAQILGRARSASAPGFPRSGVRAEDRACQAARPSAFEPALAAGFGERAHAADIGGALGDGDHAARVEQVEGVARLDALVIGGQRQLAARGARGIPSRRRRNAGTAARCRRARNCRRRIRARRA